MKNSKIFLVILSSTVLYTSFVQSETIVLGTNKTIYSFNQQMRTFDSYFNAMRAEMYNIFEEMNRVWQIPTQENEKNKKVSELSFDIEDKRDANHVAIVVKGINMDESTDIQAKVEFDHDENPVKLLVDIFDRSIFVYYTPQYRFLSVEIKYEMKKEQKNAQSIAQVTQVGTARHGKTLRESIQLDQSQISYNKKEKTLTITIPKLTKKKVEKVIPINIK